MSPNAAKVVRVDIGGIVWGISDKHSTTNLLRQGRLVTADEEDKSFQQWTHGAWGFGVYISFIKRNATPIPGSARFIRENTVVGYHLE